MKTTRLREPNGAGIGGRFAGRSDFGAQPQLGMGSGTNKTASRDGKTRADRDAAKLARQQENFVMTAGKAIVGRQKNGTPIVKVVVMDRMF